MVIVNRVNITYLLNLNSTCRYSEKNKPCLLDLRQHQRMQRWRTIQGFEQEVSTLEKGLQITILSTSSSET